MTNKKAIELLDSIIPNPDVKIAIQTELYMQAIDLAIKALENQPRWIPVTERLPEINVEVIVTDIEAIETYVSWYLGEGFWECDNGKFNNRIIAWMPLPEPYTKEETT